MQMDGRRFGGTGGRRDGSTNGLRRSDVRRAGQKDMMLKELDPEISIFRRRPINAVASFLSAPLYRHHRRFISCSFFFRSSDGGARSPSAFLEASPYSVIWSVRRSVRRSVGNAFVKDARKSFISPILSLPFNTSGRIIGLWAFLYVSSHLYKRVCPSVCPSVRPSVTLS